MKKADILRCVDIVYWQRQAHEETLEEAGMALQKAEESERKFTMDLCVAFLELEVTDSQVLLIRELVNQSHSLVELRELLK